MANIENVVDWNKNKRILNESVEATKDVMMLGQKFELLETGSDKGMSAGIALRRFSFNTNYQD